MDSFPLLPADFDVQDVIDSRVSPYQDARGLIMQEVGKATTSIYVADFGWTMPDLQELLIQKAASGVRVVIVLDHSQSAGSTEHPLVASLVDAARSTPLLSVVIATSPESHAIMHLKTVCIDGTVTISGSFNLSGKDDHAGAQREVNQVDVIRSHKRALYYTGYIMIVHDFALTHEPQYQIVPPEATIAASTAPPEVATGAVERTPDPSTASS